MILLAISGTEGTILRARPDWRSIQSWIEQLDREIDELETTLIELGEVTDPQGRIHTEPRLSNLRQSLTSKYRERGRLVTQRSEIEREILQAARIQRDHEQSTLIQSLS